MKKEYLILIFIILMLSAYLLLHKENKDNYTLPVIEKIDISKITEIRLDKEPESILFAKKNGQWVLTKKEYAADLRSIENMLDAFKTFKLTALVSQKGNLNRYELDEKKHIHVTVTDGARTVFEFTMGKTAPTFNHTFVMLADDSSIYHANGSFRSYFDKTADDFRDKKVLEFKEKSIRQFTIKKDGLSKTLISKQEKKDKDAPAVLWRYTDGSSADKETIGSLLSATAFLECDAYLKPNDKNDLLKKAPLCELKLENEKTVSLSLFKADTEDKLFGVSSMSDDAFSISQYTGKEIITHIEKLLGIETQAEENKD